MPLHFFWQRFGIFLVFSLFLFAPKIYAIPTVDITDLSKPRALYGPWAFAPELVYSTTDPRLQKQTLKLPQFIESILGKSQGEATFALYIKSTPNVPLSIDLKHPFTLWRLYVNGQLIDSSGKIGTNSQNHKAHASHNITSFTPTSNKTLLMIQIANSQHEHIGFYGVPVISEMGMLEQLHRNVFTFESIIIALLILVGLYHIGLFTAWKRDQAPLWFGLICLAVALRLSTTGEQILIDIFPDISWETLLRLEYASGCVSLPLFVWYMDSLYPNRTARIARYGYLVIGIFFLSLCTLLPTLIFTPFLFPYEIVYLSFMLYTLIILYQSLRSKEPGSLLAFVAFFILSLCIIHDFLRFDNIITNSTDLGPYGFVLYLFAQVFILLLRYANIYRLIEMHTDNLEYMVEKRTQELSSLATQRELLLRELTHRVKNNLQFIVGLLWIQRKDANEQTSTTLKTLEGQIQSIATVHESLCTQNSISSIEVHDYIQKLILSLQQLYPELKITLKSNEAIYIKTDHTVSLGLIINELITNHIKYSNPLEMQPIHIFIEKMVNLQVVLHYNDGTDHREVFAKAKDSSFGLPKLGWPMIKEFIKQMDGEIIPYHDHLDLYFFACEFQ